MDNRAPHETSAYVYPDAEACCTSTYLWSPVLELVQARTCGRQPPVRVLDLGCGNGAFAAFLQAQGFDVTGVEASESGVREAQLAHPDLKIARGSAYDDLSAVHGQFPVITCLEVIEHCFLPRIVARNIHSLLEPGGTALVSTPYHGYWKNLALALTGRLEAHFTTLWDYGHIKFFSVSTLTTLLQGAGFVEVSVVRVGRIPPLAKTMIAVARKAPGS